MAIPLAKYITIDANDFWYSGTAEELVVNYVHPLFLRANSAASQEDNPNWHDSTTGLFAENNWKEMKVDIVTL